jgi:hypothetical protein
MQVFLIAIALLFSPLAHAQRITLASHTPVMVTSQASRSTLFVDCYKHHNQDSLTYFNGTADVIVPIPGCELSVALQTSGPGMLNANDVFDLVYTANGPCLPTNGSGAGWSGDTSGSITKRGTGYSAIDETVRGYPTNGAAITHCYQGAIDLGPIAVNQGALVGSVCTDPTAPGKVSYVRGSGATGGGAARLCVWSVDDEDMKTEVTDNGPNWTFLGFTSGGTIVDVENLDQSVNGGAGNQVVFLSGLARHSPAVSAVISMGSSVAFMPAYCGIGFSLDHGGATSPDRLAEHLSPVSTVGVAADGVSWELFGTGVHSYEPMVGMHSIQEQETTDGLARCWFRTVGGQREGLTFIFPM